MKLPAKSLPEYKRLREGFGNKNHKQEGDPKKGVAAILKVADEEKPGLRLFLGVDAYQVVQTKIKSLQEQLERYKDLTLSTDHDDVKRDS